LKTRRLAKKLSASSRRKPRKPVVLLPATTIQRSRRTDQPPAGRSMRQQRVTGVRFWYSRRFQRGSAPALVRSRGGRSRR
jgi:hypothetical protein